MVTYTSATQYIESGKSLEEKIAKIDQIILALYDTLIKAALNDNITEYTLDNGQTKINTIYKGADSVQKSITAMEFAKQKLIALLNKNRNGAIVRLVDGKNLTGNYGR